MGRATRPRPSGTPRALYRPEREAFLSYIIINTTLFPLPAHGEGSNARLASVAEGRGWGLMASSGGGTPECGGRRGAGSGHGYFLLSRDGTGGAYGRAYHRGPIVDLVRKLPLRCFLDRRRHAVVRFGLYPAARRKIGHIELTRLGGVERRGAPAENGADGVPASAAHKPGGRSTMASISESTMASWLLALWSVRMATRSA